MWWLNVARGCMLHVGRILPLRCPLALCSMTFRVISRQIKERAVWLLENGYLFDDICDMLGVSRRSVERWQRNSELFGEVIPPYKQRGRPHILPARARGDVCNLINTSPELCLDEIHDWITVAYDLELSYMTVHRLVRDIGMTHKALQIAAAERDEEARTAWKVAIRENLIAQQCITIDESSKDDRTIYRHYGRAIRGQRAVSSQPFVRGDRWSILAAMNVDGYIGVRIVPDSVDSDEFFEFIIEDVVRDLPVHAH